MTEFNDSIIKESEQNSAGKLPRVFISYSKHDADYKDTLLKHLTPLRNRVMIWHDRDLSPGEEWDSPIKEQLQQANIVLYLVTANSLATEYIQAIELPLIEQRCQNGECTLIPVIVDFCDWQDLGFAKYIALPDKAKPIVAWQHQSEAWLKVIEGLKRVLSKPGFKRSTEPVAEKSRLMGIRTQLFGRSSEIVEILTPLFERLNEIEKNGIDEAATLETCEAFVNNEMTSDEFINFFRPNKPIHTADSEPKYEQLAERLKNGEISLCLGAELPLSQPMASITQHLANLVGFEQTRGDLAEVSEYAELHPDFSRQQVVTEVKKIIAATKPSIILYQMLSKLDKPMLIIATGFDSHLLEHLKQHGKRFVVIVTNYSAENEQQRYLLNYSDRDSTSCDNNGLSTLQLMEQGYSIIYYPRGYHQYPESLLLSERDYFNAGDLLNKRYPDYLHNKLKTRGLWFLGFHPDSWEARLLAEVLLYQRRTNRNKPLVIQEQANSFAKLFWRDCQYYPDLSVDAFVAKLGAAL